MATKEEKAARDAAAAAANQAVVAERARATTKSSGALAAPRLRSAGDLSRYNINYTDDELARFRAQQAAAGNPWPSQPPEDFGPGSGDVKPPVSKPPVSKPPVSKPPVSKPPVKAPTPSAGTVARTATRAAGGALATVKGALLPVRIVSTAAKPVRAGQAAVVRAVGATGASIARGAVTTVRQALTPAKPKPVAKKPVAKTNVKPTRL